MEGKERSVVEAVINAVSYVCPLVLKALMLAAWWWVTHQCLVGAQKRKCVHVRWPLLYKILCVFLMHQQLAVLEWSVDVFYFAS